MKLVTPWVLLVMLLLLSSPARLPSTILVVPFVILFLAVYFTITEGVRLLRGDDQSNAVSQRTARSRLIAGLAAALPVLLLTLQSIGQLTVWDTLMVGVLFVITYFYIIKSSVVPSRQ